MYLWLARTVYIHRIWLYIWWFPATSTAHTPVHICVYVWYIYVCAVYIRCICGTCGIYMHICMCGIYMLLANSSSCTLWSGLPAMMCMMYIYVCAVFKWSWPTLRHAHCEVGYQRWCAKTNVEMARTKYNHHIFTLVIAFLVILVIAFLVIAFLVIAILVILVIALFTPSYLHPCDSSYLHPCDRLCLPL